jgi:hypothetical protein
LFRKLKDDSAVLFDNVGVFATLHIGSGPFAAMGLGAATGLPGRLVLQLDVEIVDSRLLLLDVDVLV